MIIYTSVNQTVNDHLKIDIIEDSAFFELLDKEKRVVEKKICRLRGDHIPPSNGS